MERRVAPPGPSRGRPMRSIVAACATPGAGPVQRLQRPGHRASTQVRCLAASHARAWSKLQWSAYSSAATQP